MKLKKLAAKVSSLILMAICCTYPKISADSHLYGTCLEGREADMGNGGSEIIIDKVDKSAIFNSGDKRSYNNTVNNAFNLIRVRCKKPIFQITFEDITYRMLPDSKELEIFGKTGCAKKVSRPALNVLSAMPIFEPKSKTVLKWSLEKGWHNVTQYDYGASTPSETIRKVIVRGDIRFIPEKFLMLYRPGNDDNCDSFNGLHPQIIDLSESNVQRIGFRAFYISGVRKIIFPEHPVEVEGDAEEGLTYESGSTEIENAGYFRYVIPGTGEGCCLLI